MDLRASRSRRSDAAVLVYLLIYACAGLALLPALSLWLDEIYQLIAVRGVELAHVPTNVAGHAGGVPLGYLTTLLSIKTLGYSAFASRLPSLVFSILSCVGIISLARRARVKNVLLAVAIFSLGPIQFRYALEARPYSTALCASIWITAVLFWFFARPSFWRVALYGALVAAGIYTQPLVVVVPLAHLLWLLSEGGERRRAGLMLGAAIMVACIAFVPWLVFALSSWQSELDHKVRAHFGVSEIQLVAKELIGLGYLGTALTVALAVYGSRTMQPRWQRFWLCYTFVPIVGVLAIDIVAGYFVAIRQMIFVVAPLAILAVLGIERLARSRARVGALLACPILAGCLYKDVYWFFRPREDWRAAAHALTDFSNAETCGVVADKSYIPVYRFYEPQLDDSLCDGRFTSEHTILVVTSPYEPVEHYEAIRKRLAARGWSELGRQDFDGPEIIRMAGPSALHEPSEGASVTGSSASSFR